jgi:hypothetical protein
MQVMVSEHRIKEQHACSKTKRNNEITPTIGKKKYGEKITTLSLINPFHFSLVR